MSMTKSRSRIDTERWRASNPPRPPLPYPICREIMRQLADLRGNNGLPDTIYLGPVELNAWVGEMKSQYGEDCLVFAQFDGVEVLPSKEPGIRVVGKLPPGWD